MKGAEVVAEILKREGVTDLPCYPRNGVIEPAAALNIKPYVVRQERTGLHMADSRERIRPEGIEPGTLTAREFTDFVAAEYKRWAPVVRASGAKAD